MRLLLIYTGTFYVSVWHIFLNCKCCNYTVIICIHVPLTILSDWHNEILYSFMMKLLWCPIRKQYSTMLCMVRQPGFGKFCPCIIIFLMRWGMFCCISVFLLVVVSPLFFNFSFKLAFYMDVNCLPNLRVWALWAILTYFAVQDLQIFVLFCLTNIGTHANLDKNKTKQ